MKLRLTVLVISKAALSSCSSTSALIEVPIDVVATVSMPRYTGWQIDYCEGDESTDPETTCVSHGGEIYKAKLSDVRTPDGRRLVATLTIGFPAHALPRDFRARKRLHLVKAADDLKRDAGIEFVASHWE